MPTNIFDSNIWVPKIHYPILLSDWIYFMSVALTVIS